MSSDGARRRRSGGVKGRSSSFYEEQHRQPGTASYFQDTGSGGRRPPFRDTNESRGRQRSKSSQRYQHQHHPDSRGAQSSVRNNRRSRSCDPHAYSNRRSSNGRAATTAPTDTATGTPIRTTAVMGGTRGRAAGEAAAVAAAEAVIGTPRSGTVAAAVAG